MQAQTAVKTYTTVALAVGTYRIAGMVEKVAKSSWNALRTRRARKNIHAVK